MLIKILSAESSSEESIILQLVPAMPALAKGNQIQIGTGLQEP